MPFPALIEIGVLVRQRREVLGLSQARLARLAGLSRATINQLETGALVELGVNKLASLMALMGLQLLAGVRETARPGLHSASQTASVSFKVPMPPRELAKALATGDLPPRWLPHVATLLDEAPLPLIVAAVEDAARTQDVPAKVIWQHVVRWAHELRSPRPAWS